VGLFDIMFFLLCLSFFPNVFILFAFCKVEFAADVITSSDKPAYKDGAGIVLTDLVLDGTALAWDNKNGCLNENW